jgi:hypothetical protein
VVRPTVAFVHCTHASNRHNIPTATHIPPGLLNVGEHLRRMVQRRSLRPMYHLCKPLLVS